MEVRALLAMGVERAAKDDARGSAAFYRAALDLAGAKGDVSGQARAAIGYAIGLDDLGYQDDALQVVADVAANLEVDADHARRLARAMVHRCRVVGQREDALRWLTEAESLSPARDPQIAFATFTLAFDQADYASVVALAETDVLPSVTPTQGALGWALASVAAYLVGDTDRASAFLDASGDSEHRELISWRAVARWIRDRDNQPRQADDRLVAALRAALYAPDGSAPTVWVVRAVDVAIERLFAVGAHDAAWLLGRLLFLDDAEASDPTVRFAGIVGGAEHSWVVTPEVGAIRRVSLSAHAIAHMASASRDGAQMGVQGGRSDSLDVLLGDLGAGPIVFGATHGLHDLPVVTDGARRDVLLRCVAPGTRYRAEAAAGFGIASIADPFGDLPGANTEIPQERCSIWRRGVGASLAALTEARDVGFLHLGVHGGRRNGVPQLLLADGAVTPPEIEGFTFSARPVVLLSGCATAARAHQRGIEQSFAAAFRRAGASAVVCTRWAVEDRAMAEFSAALVARWPFSDPLLAVGHVCRALAAAHRPPEVWGGIVVY